MKIEECKVIRRKLVHLSGMIHALDDILANIESQESQEEIDLHGDDVIHLLEDFNNLMDDADSECMKLFSNHYWSNV